MPENDQTIENLRSAVRRLADLTRARRRTGVTHQAADDELGTVATDDAIGFDPFPVLRALDRVGVRAVVIGQVAGIMHGSRELTGDLDLLWDGDPACAAAIAAAFRDVGAEIADDDEAPLDLGVDAFRLPKVLFHAPTASGDCCTPALDWGELPVRDFLARAVSATSDDGVTIHYLGLDDLIAMRRAAGRPKDVRRAAELAALRDENG